MEVKMNEDDKMMKIQSFTYLMLINMFCILKRKNKLIMIRKIYNLNEKQKQIHMYSLIDMTLPYQLTVTLGHDGWSSIDDKDGFQTKNVVGGRP